MFLGFITNSNNKMLEGKKLCVNFKIYIDIEDRLNPYLKYEFLNVRDHFTYDLVELIEMTSSKEDNVVKHAVVKYKIIVRYNYKRYWVFDGIDKSDIIIFENDIFKGE